MKKFRFKFDHVLKLRKKREDEALRLLAAAQAKQQEQIQLKNHYHLELDKAFKNRLTLGEALVSVLQFSSIQDYIEGTKKRIQFTEQAIIRAGRFVEKAMWNYLNAKKQSMILEVLFEKQYEAYKQAQKKHELKDQDDITVMRFMQGRGEE